MNKKHRLLGGYTVTTIGKQEFQRIKAEHEEHAQSRKEQVQRDAADISKREPKNGRYAIGDAFVLLLAANGGKSVKLGLAIDNGEIPCYESEDAVPKDVRSLGYETTDEVHRDDLNKWISENCRLLDYRFPNPSAALVATAGAPGRTGTVWTAERIEAARKMKNDFRGQGIRAYAKKTAAEFGVTPTRLREVLKDKPKKAPAKKSKGFWDV
jgi:hypothetical protein